jgi:hypothetical protein
MRTASRACGSTQMPWFRDACGEDGIGARFPGQHLHHLPAGQESASLLGFKPATLKPHHSGLHRDRPCPKVEVLPPECGALADAETRGQHHGHEVGQVPDIIAIRHVPYSALLCPLCRPEHLGRGVHRTPRRRRRRPPVSAPAIRFACASYPRHPMPQETRQRHAPTDPRPPGYRWPTQPAPRMTGTVDEPATPASVQRSRARGHQAASADRSLLLRGAGRTRPAAPVTGKCPQQLLVPGSDDDMRPVTEGRVDRISSWETGIL